MKLLDKLFEHKKEEKIDFNPNDDYRAIDFYLMLSYYDTSSLNIAVIGNEAKYKWVINNIIEEMCKDTSIYNKIIKKSDNHYLFFRGEQEVNFIHIESLLEDLEKYNMKYRKYM